jgi:hypothetical protein
LSAAGIPLGSILVGNDGAGQPIIWFDTAVISEGDIAWWAGPNTPDGYTNKLKATLTQNFSAPYGGGTCVEGKAWYDESTGNLVRLNTLDGADVTATVSSAALREGACGRGATKERLICADIIGLGVMNALERTETTYCGTATLSYYNPDTSPMGPIAPADIKSIIRGAECCCADYPL